MIVFVLVLLLCLALPILIVTACMLYCLITRQIKATDNLYSMTPKTISTVESAAVDQTITTHLPSNIQTSIAIKHENGLNTDDVPSAAFFTFTRTPFGTRTPAAFDLGASLRASWTVAGQSQGPDSLATALEGVLALYCKLEELKHQRDDTRLEDSHRFTELPIA